MAVDLNDTLLRYFQNELSYLRNSGADFAHKYPKIADRLEFTGRKCPDPNIEMLLQSFAFLTGRLQYNFDAEAPNIPTTLLSTLYPHLEAPIPSMSIARFQVDSENADAEAGFLIPRHSNLYTEPKQGPTCKFHTCYDTQLWPVDVTDAGLVPSNEYSFLDKRADILSVIRLRIEMQANSTFEDLPVENLRFYLNGDNHSVYALYELLSNNLADIVLLGDTHKRPVYLTAKALKPVGFDDGEQVLPYNKRSHPAYRLLEEYFCFPEKYLFFDLSRLNRVQTENSFEVLLLLNQLPGKRVKVNTQTFLLGCTPVINLYRKTTDPVRLDNKQSEYRLVPDENNYRSCEIHTIEKVYAKDLSGKPRLLTPFFSYNYDEEEKDQGIYWSTRRQYAESSYLPGTEIHIAIHNQHFEANATPSEMIYARTVCTNRDLAEQLSANTVLQLDGVGPIKQISLLEKPTPHQNPLLRGKALWQLISHLSLNHLSLTSGADGLKALQNLLKIYAHSEHTSVHQQINGLRDMSCRKVTRRLGPDAWRGFCYGTEITLQFNEKLYEGGSAFLFGAVLNQFFQLYSSINSFTQLKIISEQREGSWKVWPPMVGEKQLL